MGFCKLQALHKTTRQFVADCSLPAKDSGLDFQAVKPERVKHPLLEREL